MGPPRGSRGRGHPCRAAAGSACRVPERGGRRRDLGLQGRVGGRLARRARAAAGARRRRAAPAGRGRRLPGPATWRPGPARRRDLRSGGRRPAERRAGPAGQLRGRSDGLRGGRRGLRRDRSGCGRWRGGGRAGGRGHGPGRLLLDAAGRRRALAAAGGDDAGRRGRRRRSDLGRPGARSRCGRRGSAGASSARRPSWSPSSGLGLLGLDLADQALALGLAADAVGLRILDARGMRLDADPQRLAEVEGLLVGEAELLGELVHALLACQVPWSSPSLMVVLRPSILARTRGLARFELPGGEVSACGGPSRGPGAGAQPPSTGSTRRRATHLGRQCTARPGAIRPSGGPPGRARRPERCAGSPRRCAGEPLPLLRRSLVARRQPRLRRPARVRLCVRLRVRLVGASSPSSVASPPSSEPRRAASSPSAGDAHSSAEIVSPPSAGTQTCSPDSGSTTHSPWAHSSPW